MTWYSKVRPRRDASESGFTRVMQNSGLLMLTRCGNLSDIFVILGTTDSVESCRLAFELVGKCADSFAT
jgi:hypothetical protein